MNIVKDKFFTDNLRAILRYIALDSMSRAYDFNNALSKKINTLPVYPYKYRQSYYYNKEEVRDFTFKGYTIPYLIDNTNEVIVLLDIFKWSQR